MPDKESPPDPEKLQEENRSLRTAVEELKILNEIATAIGSVSSLEDVMGLIVRKCIKHLGAEQAAVILVEPEGGGRFPMEVRHFGVICGSGVVDHQGNRLPEVRPVGTQHHIDNVGMALADGDVCGSAE